MTLETSLPIATHASTVKRWLSGSRVGTEIGAFESPVPGITPIYVDRFSEYAGKPCRADYWGDACALPFRSHSLDYVVTSHVLEHVANPVAALLEWHRVLRSGGVIYMVVPDRRFTFDHPRHPTSPEHMWADFEQSATQRDGSHIDDFVNGVDWSQFSPDTPPEQIEHARNTLAEQYRSAIAQQQEINIHFHVFESGNLRGLVELVAQRKRLAWEVLASNERFPTDCPNGILMVIRIRKFGREALISQWNAWRARFNRNWVVSPEAKPLSSDAEMRQTH